ncbi:acyl-CoA N-acyltransferase [Xylariales sp. PMI_506]|nr:acyl-CoA N-acyltransferase [Xylariales sp. PMI_506]
MTPYKVEVAQPSDAEGLAAISNADEPTPFRRLMNGTSRDDKKKENADNVEMWSNSITQPGQLILLARDEATGTIVSFAQWIRPSDSQTQAKSPPTEEEKRKLRETQESHISAGQNGPLLLAFWDNLSSLRDRAFGLRRRWYLNNLATLAAHRGRGLAAQLVRWPFADADRDGDLVCLYTDGEGKAKALYEKLGFVERGRFVLELDAFGGIGHHVEVAMVRDTGRK